MMESTKEIKILDDLNINYDNLVNSTLDVFNDCILIINSDNIEKKVILSHFFKK